MKKIKIEGKLKLNKETISNLSDEQMRQLNGGAAQTTLTFCNAACSDHCSESQICCFLSTNDSCPCNSGLTTRYTV